MCLTSVKAFAAPCGACSGSPDLHSCHRLMHSTYLWQITVGKASQQHPKAMKSGKASYKTFHGDTVTLKPGTLVAVNLAKYEEWPQIGEVISSQQDTLTLSWYDGLYSTPWMKVKLKNGNDWKETVSKDTLIMYDITLTAGQRLRKDTVEKLKNSFENSN